MPAKPKVAICQSGIIFGGRLRVIVGIVEIFNEAGIVPDILTSRLTIRPEQIAEKYGRPIQANYRLLPRIPKLPGEFARMLFNAILGHYASGYDLLINTSNSLIFLPKSENVITYMFFPRKRRVMADVIDIHQPDMHFVPWSFVRLQRPVLRTIYRLSKSYSNHQIVCMTEFTRSALEQEYDIPSNLPVIYPPVDIATFRNNCPERTRSVVTVGRFGPDKRQLEQIKLAEQLPDIPFHIVGFAGNVHYYRRCKLYAKEHELSNVHLHPDAPFEQMVALLQESKFFLHTLINEPFGITAVQAIAAGCLPIVHDSGGQCETVPEPALRYQSLDEVQDILRRLEALDADTTGSLIQRLQQYIISHFDETVFYRKMRSVLMPYLVARLPDENLLSNADR